jgi:hypothetical protein
MVGAGGAAEKIKELCSVREQQERIRWVPEMLAALVDCSIERRVEGAAAQATAGSCLRRPRFLISVINTNDRIS